MIGLASCEVCRRENVWKYRVRMPRLVTGGSADGTKAARKCGRRAASSLNNRGQIASSGAAQHRRSPARHREWPCCESRPGSAVAIAASYPRPSACSHLRLTGRALVPYRYARSWSAPAGRTLAGCRVGRKPVALQTAHCRVLPEASLPPATEGFLQPPCVLRHVALNTAMWLDSVNFPCFRG